MHTFSKVVFSTVLAGAGALAVLWSAQAVRPATAHAADRSPVLVELFTSEGCSSCPPADALLREWNGHTTASGRKIIGLSEHVTYWNHLGWTDPYSAEGFTERQNRYGERFRLNSVFTPQMVVNGRTQLVANERAGVLAAWEAQPAYPLTVELQSAHYIADRIDMSARISGKLPNLDADLFAAVTDDMDQTEVRRGENAGDTLHHTSVAREIVRIGRVHPDGNTISYMVPLPPSVRSGDQRGHHIVLFAQGPRLGEVYGADTIEVR